MPNFPNSRDVLIDNIPMRWRIPDWDLHYPWWRPPATVRILMYGEGSMRFNGGPFQGLQYVLALLKNRAYPYVKFDVTTAHRDGDASATIPQARQLTDLDIVNKFDQVWFFGTGSTPELTAAEVTLMTTFMAAPKFGGVLVTGDHANLGASIAQQIPRAGEMRRYPAPEAAAPGWNTTLEEGRDLNSDFDFDEQSDDTPQTLRLRRYGLTAARPYFRRQRPHSVFCGPEGLIDVMPDHEHEGEAIAPAVAPGNATWPTKNGYQEAPAVIAWGRIKDPAATKHGQEIGVCSAYDGHNVDVGRILADSTWHHWFDINLVGRAGSPDPYVGFAATPAGQAALKKIDAYFLNCGVWLAPPDKQRQMRNFGLWSVVWTDTIAELSVGAGAWRFGAEALSVLGKRAPQCTIASWLIDLPIFKEKIPRWEWPQFVDRFQVIDLPLETCVLGGIVRQLKSDFGAGDLKRAFPDKPPSDSALDKVIDIGAAQGLRDLHKMLQQDMGVVAKLADAGFFGRTAPTGA